MTKITKLDKMALKNLRDPLEAELAALGARLGLTFKIGSGQYGAGTDASFKLLIEVDDPVAKTAAAKAKWDANCRYIGQNVFGDDPVVLRPEDFGTEFEVKGTRYRTNGLALGRSKYPIGVETLTGPKAGSTLFFTELAVPVIRAATDAKVAA